MKKVWLITGCSSGIGAALANKLLEQSEFVVVTARNYSSIKHFEDKYPNQALCLCLDITKREDIDIAVAKTVDKLGRIDILVNNAGISHYGVIEDVPEENLRQVMETNFWGTVNLTQKVLPIMRNQSSGTIINISSIAAKYPAVGAGIYASSKIAMETMMQVLSKETEQFGIKVVNYRPWEFRTNFLKNLKYTKSENHIYSELTKRVINNLENQDYVEPKSAEECVEEILSSYQQESSYVLLELPLEMMKQKNNIKGIKNKIRLKIYNYLKKKLTRKGLI